MCSAGDGKAVAGQEGGGFVPIYEVPEFLPDVSVSFCFLCFQCTFRPFRTEGNAHDECGTSLPTTTGQER